MEDLESEAQLEMEATKHLLEKQAEKLQPPPPLPRTKYLFFMDFLITPTPTIVLDVPNSRETVPDEGAVHINFFPRHFVLMDVDAKIGRAHV